MDAEKPPAETGVTEQSAPEDALTKPTDVIDATTTASPIADGNPQAASQSKPPKRPGALRKFLKRFNLYFLLFLLIVAVAAVVATVAYLNSRKQPKEPDIASQVLSPDEVKQLANSDATVGGSGQTLTVQGNAIFNGQVLVRSNLNVAGSITLGSTLVIPDITVSHSANFTTAQADTLQVANGSTFQGTVTIQHDVNVGGNASIASATIGQLTVTKLIMSGNAQIQVPNHIAFTGASPSRAIGPALGSGGSSSVYGSDTSGTVNINTGNGPSAGCFINITFHQRFTSTPHVLISPVGAAAGQTQYYATRSVSGFSICTDNAAPANQTFAFDYFVTD